ncbi:MAG: hypothetical protein RSC68_23515 [Acinetobacter sp.]
MNAIQFIKEKGVEKAMEVVDGAPALDCYFDPYDSSYMSQAHQYEWEMWKEDIKQWDVCEWDVDVSDYILLSDLKRLVESVDYVSIYGYEKSKDILKNAPVGAECYSWLIGNSGIRDKTVDLVKLKQAIADYESIGGEHV